MKVDTYPFSKFKANNSPKFWPIKATKATNATSIFMFRSLSRFGDASMQPCKTFIGEKTDSSLDCKHYINIRL